MSIRALRQVQLLGLLLAVAAGVHAATEQTTPIVGQWLTETRGGIIQIEALPDGTYQGRVAGGNEPGRLDSKNPDPALRNKPLMGQVIMRGLRSDGDGKWSGGTIYDADSGSVYQCSITLLAPDRIKLRGFIGFSLIGRSQVWTRYHAKSPALGANTRE